MEQRRWHQALVLSLVLNLFAVLAAGGMFGLSASVAEELIEVEILSASPQQPVLAAAAIPPTAPAARAQAVPAQAIPAIQSSMEQAEVVQPSFSGEQASLSEQPIVDSGGRATPATAAGTSAASQTTSARTVLPPRVLQRVEPAYPQAARQQGLEGTVRVRIEVEVDGSAGSVFIAASSGYDILDKAALQAVRQWRFVPAKAADTGMAVPCVTSLSIAFRLNS